MVGMSETTNSPTPIEVPVRTRGWQSMVMVVCAGFMCLAQTAFAAQRFGQDSAVYVWMVFCMLVAFAIGFLLLARSRYPRATFVAACVVVLVFPYDPILALMALTALLARRNDMKTTVRAIVAGGFVTLAAQVRDALRPPEASIWHMVFAKPDTGSQYGTDLIMLADDRTIVITAIVAALLELAIATLAGLHIRSRALASLATAKADAADAQVAQLKTTIDSQQLADAIAAEAHDTLAHSLSLLALNASALQAESKRLVAEAESWTRWPNRPAGSRSLDAAQPSTGPSGRRVSNWRHPRSLTKRWMRLSEIAQHPAGQLRKPAKWTTNAAPGSSSSHRRRARALMHSSQRYASRHECKRHVSDWRRIARTGGTRPPVRRNMPIRF